jgi:hypothetical protein
LSFTGKLTPDDGGDLKDFHVERPALAHEFAQALSAGTHVFVHGLPRQGKSTLVRHALDGTDAVTVHASADIGFADIFRTYLVALGCSVSVEHSKRKKLGSKAEIGFKWPIFSATGDVEAETEGSDTTRSVAADISSPNDICYLLKEYGAAPVLVIDRFEQLSRKARKFLLDSLTLFSDSGVLRIVLIGAAGEAPLDPAEQIALSRYVTLVHVPPLSPAETDVFVNALLQHIGQAPVAGLAVFLGDLFAGALQMTLDACQIAVKVAPGAGADRQAVMLAAIQDWTRNYFLALLDAIIDKGWTIACTRRLARQPASPEDYLRIPDATRARIPIASALANDTVFTDLQSAIFAAQDKPPQIPAELADIHAKASELGKLVLNCDLDAERLRLLAFSLNQVVAAPLEALNAQYAPVHGAQKNALNVGLLFADFLSNADLSEPLVLTAEGLRDVLAQDGWDIDAHLMGNDTPFVKTAKRVRKLQRKLAIDPQLFGVDDDCTAITLWSPADAKIFGDVKPHLKELLEADDDSDE